MDGDMLSFFCLIILTVWLIYKMLLARLARKDYRDHGCVTTANVIDKEVLDDGDGGDTCLITIQFVVDRQPYTRKIEVQATIYDDCIPGSPVEVVYLPDDPNFVRPARDVFTTKQLDQIR